MDEEIKELMKRLGTAINGAVQESEEIQLILQEMEAKGLSMTLSLAVIIGLNQQDGVKKKLRKIIDGINEELDTKMTAFDRKFLKALRIKLN